MLGAGMSKVITAREYRRLMGLPDGPVDSAVDVVSTKQQARGLSRNVRGEMNKTEIRYQQHCLEIEHRAGRVAWFDYEPFRFRLADQTFACPDFAVMLADGAVELHEVKGTTTETIRGAKVRKPLVTEAGLLRFKLARERYWMFRWRLMYFVDGLWHECAVGNGGKRKAA
jgi:hypothetical protein